MEDYLLKIGTAYLLQIFYYIKNVEKYANYTFQKLKIILQKENWIQFHSRKCKDM